MFVAAGGRERSVSQYAALLQQADLSLTATTPLPSGYVLMEATGERWRKTATLEAAVPRAQRRQAEDVSNLFRGYGPEMYRNARWNYVSKKPFL
jgi:hypothetical protein